MGSHPDAENHQSASQERPEEERGLKRMTSFKTCLEVLSERFDVKLLSQPMVVVYQAVLVCERVWSSACGTCFLFRRGLSWDLENLLRHFWRPPVFGLHDRTSKSRNLH